MSLYLDHAASAPLRPEARAAMVEVWDHFPGNASSVHSFGFQAHRIIDKARCDIATAFNASPEEIIFTSGGTEANNLAIKGIAAAEPRGRHIITSPLEHSSILESCAFLQRQGFKISLVDVTPEGLVNHEHLHSLLTPETTLVTFALANAEIGTVQQVPEITTPLHLDAVQAAPALPIEFNSTSMALASHKFGGPQGVGALIVKASQRIEPIIHGGGQENGLRSGTENVAGIAGFAAAVVASRKNIGLLALELIDSREKLIATICNRVPQARLTGHPTERIPGHASFVIEGISGEALLIALDMAGYAVSSGSACKAGSTEPSATLLAIGIEPERARTAIRFSFATPLNDTDIVRISEIIANECAGH